MNIQPGNIKFDVLCIVLNNLTLKFVMYALKYIQKAYQEHDIDKINLFIHIKLSYHNDRKFEQIKCILGEKPFCLHSCGYLIDAEYIQSNYSFCKFWNNAAKDDKNDPIKCRILQKFRDSTEKEKIKNMWHTKCLSCHN